MITSDALDLLPQVQESLHGINDSLSAIILLSQAKKDGDMEAAARKALVRLVRLAAVRRFMDALQVTGDARRQFLKLV